MPMSAAMVEKRRLELRAVSLHLFQKRKPLSCRDDVFSRLLTFPNVVITGHQAFLTNEALAAIASTTLSNLTSIERGEPCAHQVHAT